jgi:hypothetical protein
VARRDEENEDLKQTDSEAYDSAFDEPETNPAPDDDDLHDEDDDADTSESDDDDAGETNDSDKDKDDGKGGDDDDAEIDYKAELDKLLEKTKSWEGRLKASDRRNAELSQELEERKRNPAADKATDSDDDDLDPDSAKAKLEAFYEEFPSLREPLQILTKQAVSEATGKVNDAIMPVVKRHNETVNGEHLTAIREAHSDMDEILESGDLTSWFDTLSPRKAQFYRSIAAEGDTSEVIDMLTDFKEANGIKTTDPDTDDGKTVTRQQSNRRDKQADDLAPIKGERTRPNARRSGQPDKDDYDGAFDEDD